MPQTVTLELSKEELESAVGPLGAVRSWHRLEERVSRYNRRGRELGVRLSTCRGAKAVRVMGGGLDALHVFQREIGGSIGRVQRAVGLLLERKLAETAAPDALEALRRRQALDLAAQLAFPLFGVEKLASWLPRALIEAPFRSGAGARSALDSIERCLRSPTPRALLIVGSSGAGKSGLLLRVLAASPPDEGPLVYLPANRLAWGSGSSTIDWARSLPGESRPVLERLETSFLEGRLRLLIDGLDGNPELLDLTRPEVSAFWTQASRGRCVVTCRDLFSERHVFRSALHGLLRPTLEELTLVEWTASDASRLYRRVAAASVDGVEPIPGIGHLARLSVDALADKLKGLRLNALSAWGYAAYFGRSKPPAFPKNEFALLGHVFDLTLARERASVPLRVPSDLLRGMLLRVGWAAYRNGFSGGALGDDARVGLRELKESMNRDFPFHAELGPAIFEALMRLPRVAFDGVHGSLRLDRDFAAFLAATWLLELADRSDPAALAEAFRTPLVEQPTRLLYEGIDLLDVAGRRRFWESGRRAFDESWRAYRVSPEEGSVTAMQGLLQPISRLGLEEASDWIRGLLEHADELPAAAFMSLGRALAYLGAEEGVSRFLRELRRRPAFRRANRDFYRYWLKDARPPTGRPDRFGELRGEGWERSCRWLMQRLLSKDSARLRRLHLYTFLDLWDTHGRPCASSKELLALAKSLEADAASSGKELRGEAGALIRRIRRPNHR